MLTSQSDLRILGRWFLRDITDPSENFFLAFVLSAASIGIAQAAPDFELSSDALSRLLARNEAPRELSRDTGDDSAGQRSSPSGFVQQMRNTASDMVRSSMKFLGVPYVRGGTSAAGGFDCSGFTRYIFEHSLGLMLPRRADEQAKAEGLMNVRRDDLKPGDLVFFNTLRRTFSHVGIYIGEGKFIHSPRAGGEVRVEDMRESYWTKRFTGGRRVPQIEGGSGGLPSLTASVPTVSMGGTNSFSTSSFGAAPGASSDPLGLAGNASPSNP